MFNWAARRVLADPAKEDVAQAIDAPQLPCNAFVTLYLRAL